MPCWPSPSHHHVYAIYGAPGVELREEVSQVCVPQPGKKGATRRLAMGTMGKSMGKMGKSMFFFSKCFSMDFPTNKSIGFWFPPGKKPYGFSHCWTCFRLLPTKQKPIGFDLGTFPIRGFKSLKFLGAQIRFSGWKSGNYVDWPVAKWGDPPRAGSYEQLCTYIPYNINIMYIYIWLHMAYMRAYVGKLSASVAM